MDQTASMIEEAVQALWEAAALGDHFPKAWIGRFDVDTGYRVQLGLLARHVAAGRSQAGWKVGLTSKVVQQQSNFHEPVFGYLLADGQVDSGSEVPAGQWIQPAFESELCVRLGRSLAGPGVTTEQARAALAAIAPALELVEMRGSFNDSAPLCIADNVGQKGYVTGAWLEPLPVGLSLPDVHAEVRKNGELLDQADGRAVLGDPAAPVAWLANRLADFGRTLDAGSIVITGSFTRYYPLAPGDTAEASFEPVGTVTVHAR